MAPGRMERKATPAGADLEHVVVRPEFELAADCFEFRGGRFRECHVRALEQRARVHHGFVEHQAEELVAQVIVRRDVAAASGASIPMQPVGGYTQRRRGAREARLHCVERRAVAQHQAHQGREVVRPPVAEHVRFPRAYRPAESDVGVERRIEDSDRCRRTGARLAKRPGLAALTYAQAPVADSLELSEHEPAGEGAERARALFTAGQFDQCGVGHVIFSPVRVTGWS